MPWKIHGVHTAAFNDKGVISIRPQINTLVTRNLAASMFWLSGKGDCAIRGGGVNQAYSRLSTTHGHITDCKFNPVVYAGVCVVS